MKLERILCPLDFSEFSARAFEYALSLARRYKSKLLVEHVLHLPFSAYPSYVNAEAIDNVSQGLSAFAREQLEDFLRKQTSKGIEIESFVDEGDVTDTILAFAQKRAVDLIVMGTHGRQVIDSTSEHMRVGSLLVLKTPFSAACKAPPFYQPTNEVADFCN